MSVAAAAEQSVPFWLQIATVVLAPLLGFVGVAIGVVLKDSSDRRLALRQARQSVYVIFLRSLMQINWTFASTAATAVQSGDVKRTAAVYRSVMDLLGTLPQTAAEIDLIGSDHTSKIVHKYLVITLDLSLTMRGAISGSFDRKKWLEASRRVNEFVFEFRDAAILDLRVPVRQRRRIHMSQKDSDANLGLIESYLQKQDEAETDSKVAE
jgi:hypothetical protein